MMTCDQCQHSVTAYEFHTKQNLCEHLFLDALARPTRHKFRQVRVIARTSTHTAA